MKKKVLLVEDTATISKFVQFRLEKAGFDVNTAAGGEEALELVKAYKPDIILLDYGLPGMDGGEVAKFLKSKEMFKRIPIIMFSATEDNLKRIKEFGADDGILKPYEPEELIGKIRRHLEKG